jgi:hypothetical protein
VIRNRILPALTIAAATLLGATAAVSAGGPAIAPPPPFPYLEFHAVPRLGAEPVRGTGCGSQGQIGAVIPDGLWAGYAAVAGGVVSVDLLCVYTPEAAAGVVAAGTATIVNDDPQYLVVNNSTRVRSMPAAYGIQLGDAALTVDGRCINGSQVYDHTAMSNRQAWVNIYGGAVTWILWGCEPFPETPGNLPPAYPDYSDGLGRVWPYGAFEDVPQLGDEPVRGSGCSTSGQIGAVIPDGLWAGYPTAYDWSTNTIGINMLCIFYGDSAQYILAQGTANIVGNQPDYLIVNNNDRVRSMPSNLTAIILGQYDAAGTCVEGEHLSPESVDQFPARYGQQAWIRIDQGVVTWVFYDCP